MSANSSSRLTLILSAGIIAITAWVFGAFPVAQLFQYLHSPFPSRNSAHVLQDLRPYLSENASVIIPGDATFDTATQRWQAYHGPHIGGVVEVHTEDDIAQTIKFANRHSKPILAFVSGHGGPESLSAMQDGIQISMQSMNHIHIASDGKTARIGGGVTSKLVADTLAAAGKQTVTGVCECVGLLGPALGGGHGVLQGKHGLLADQIVSARLVLANGTAITVSASQHPDLLWALKGAGHNFGIVSEVEYRIYDADSGPEEEAWAYELSFFSNDKLEALYELMNDMMADQPENAMNFAYMLRVPDVDPEHAIIMHLHLYLGPPSAAARFTNPIRALQPLNTLSGTTTYASLPQYLQVSLASPACQRGQSSLRFPLYLRRHNTTALRELYAHFDATMRAEPRFNESFFILEGYSMHAVQAVAEESTAFAWRAENLLYSPCVRYEPDAALDEEAVAFGRELRAIVQRGCGGERSEGELRTYVNYAFGDEGVESVYGREGWRVEELRRLKGVFDPGDVFGFYVPVGVGGR